jgi:hypothetical protein
MVQAAVLADGHHKHRRGQSGQRHFQENGTQANETMWQPLLLSAGCIPALILLAAVSIERQPLSDK